MASWTRPSACLNSCKLVLPDPVSQVAKEAAVWAARLFGTNKLVLVRGCTEQQIKRKKEQQSIDELTHQVPMSSHQDRHLESPVARDNDWINMLQEVKKDGVLC